MFDYNIFSCKNFVAIPPSKYFPFIAENELCIIVIIRYLREMSGFREVFCYSLSINVYLIKVVVNAFIFTVCFADCLVKRKQNGNIDNGDYNGNIL